MPNEPLALAIHQPAAPSEADYRALCAALSESERGRALLDEFARRSRSADTAMLLAAIERVEARLRADASAVERLRDDLRMLLIAIRLVRPEIDAAVPAAQVGKLVKLLDLLERRIDSLAEGKPAERAPPAEAAFDIGPEEPELPSPSPAAVEPRQVEKAAVEPATQPPSDPLAAIMALSEDERLALFT